MKTGRSYSLALTKSANPTAKSGGYPIRRVSWDKKSHDTP